MKEEQIFAIIGLIFALPTAFLTMVFGKTCVFGFTLWPLSDFGSFLFLPLLMIVFSLLGFLGSFLTKRNLLLSIICMLTASIVLFTLNPFTLILSYLFFFLDGIYLLATYKEKRSKVNKRQKLEIIGTLVVVISLIVIPLYTFNPILPSGDFVVKVNYLEKMAFYDDLIVWAQRETEEIKCSKDYIYLYNMTTGKKTLVNDDPVRVEGLGVYGDKVVWSANRNIYMYDINTKNISKLTSGDGGRLKIYGDVVVWVENIYRVFEPKLIYLYNITSGEKRQVSSEVPSQARPDIYKNLIVWKGYGQNGTRSIYLYNIETEEKREIITNLSGNNYFRNDISIFEDKIVYGDGDTLYLYNISTGEISTLMKHSRAASAYRSSAHFPIAKIYGNYILVMESSEELVGMDEFETFTKFWVYNIESKEKVEIKAGSYIHSNKIINIIDGAINVIEITDLFQ